VSVSVANDAYVLVVLVVEDEYFVRCNIATCLRDAGYVVIETASGEEAFALCRSDMSIDIVFTDINLIGPATGWDVAEYFRIERPDVPVLYTSGKAVDAQRRVPGSEFVAKPYKSADILKAFQRLHTA
jgi:CheY-like chemotaxis protein